MRGDTGSCVARSGPCCLFAAWQVAGPTSTLLLSPLRKNVLARENNVGPACTLISSLIQSHKCWPFQRTYLIGTLYFKSDTVSARESIFRLLHTYIFNGVIFDLGHHFFGCTTTHDDARHYFWVRLTLTLNGTCLLPTTAFTNKRKQSQEEVIQYGSCCASCRLLLLD